MSRFGTIRKRIVSLLLAVMVVLCSFSGVIFGEGITARAENTENYTVLLWSPKDVPSFTGNIRSLLKEVSSTNLTIKERINQEVLTTSDLEGVHLIYLLMVNNSVPAGYSLSTGANSANVAVLSNFVNAGGRIVMNGEHGRYCPNSNSALSELAGALGAEFTIENDISSERKMILNTEAKSGLTVGCENIFPNAFAPITATNPAKAIWVMKDKDDNVFVMDQAAGKGYITALADINWAFPESSYELNTSEKREAAKEAAKQLLVNLLTDSAEHMETIAGAPIVSGPDDLSWFCTDDTPRTLSLTATSPNDGELTYQWYQGPTKDFSPDDSDATILNNETGPNYEIPDPGLMNVGEYYYKCVVTNKKGDAEASQVVSAIATVKPLAGVKVLPEPIQYIYDNTEKVLCTEGVAIGGDMQYALGDESSVTTDWGSEPPRATAPGTYYVWYRAYGTMGNPNSEPECIVSNIIQIQAEVVVPPSPRKYEYNGQARELVIPGTAKDGTMMYALGDSNAPDTDWSTDIPKGTEIGNYYVWYKAKGDINKLDSSENFVISTIYLEGKMETDVKKHDNTPDTSVKGLTESLAWALATSGEQTAIKNSGVNGKLWLEITNIDSSVSSSDKQKLENGTGIISDAKVGMYLDFSVFLQIGSNNARKINDLKGNNISIEMIIPQNLRAPGVKRTFYLVSVHNGIVRIHGNTTTDKMIATLFNFSTYAIVYADDIEKIFESNITITQTRKKIIINWEKTDGVAKVAVYLAYCGSKYPNKPVKTTTKRSAKVTKIKGKKINQKKNYKMYLVAYDYKGNEMGRSLELHFAGKDCKYTNPKSLKLSASALTVKVGQKTRIKGKIKYEDKKKKHLSEKHAPKFRYVSDYPAIATVDSKGNITGVSPGGCDIYVCCQNGISKYVTVTVTE